MEFPFLIGCDPEFTILSQNIKLDAKETIQRALSSVLSSSDMGYTIKGAGNIGWDGCSSTGEVRPCPDNNPKNIINNIGKLISTLARNMQWLKFYTLSSYGSVGGHIHLDLPSGVRRDDEDAMNILHDKMAFLSLPIIMGDNKLNLSIRRKGGYGKLDDYRVESHGRNATYEFRVPSAEWMITPKIAEATLSYIACIYHEINSGRLDNIKEIKQMSFNNNLQLTALDNITMADYKPIRDVLLNKIKKIVRQSEFYPQCKEQIEYILRPDQIKKDKAKFEFEISKGWGMSEQTRPNKRLLTLKSIAEKEATSLMKFKSRNIKDSIVFNHNSDVHVSDFVSQLKKTVLAFNWRLNNNYYFFGVSEEIPGYIVVNGKMEIIKGEEIVVNSEVLEKITNTANKMVGKLNQSNHGDRSMKPEQNIVVGIPRLDRDKLSFKPFLHLIQELEKRQPAGKSLLDKQQWTTSWAKIFQPIDKITKLEEEKESDNKLTVAIRKQTMDNISEAMLEQNSRTNFIVNDHTGRNVFQTKTEAVQYLLGMEDTYREIGAIVSAFACVGSERREVVSIRSFVGNDNYLIRS